MDTNKESVISRYWLPTLCATAFVLVSALAIILISRYPQGEWITLREVLTASPACWFWILWFVLAFISANSFTKEYRRRLRQARDEYPLVDEAYTRRLVKKEMSYRYSKMLLPVCAGWPIPYLLFHYSSETGFSPTVFAIQFLPLPVDLAVFLRLRRLAGSSR